MYINYISIKRPFHGPQVNKTAMTSVTALRGMGLSVASVINTSLLVAARHVTSCGLLELPALADRRRFDALL